MHTSTTTRSYYNSSPLVYLICDLDVTNALFGVTRVLQHPRGSSGIEWGGSLAGGCFHGLLGCQPPGSV
jgi:hypothetical protein